MQFCRMKRASPKGYGLLAHSHRSIQHTIPDMCNGKRWKTVFGTVLTEIPGIVYTALCMQEPILKSKLLILLWHNWNVLLVLYIYVCTNYIRWGGWWWCRRLQTTTLLSIISTFIYYCFWKWCGTGLGFLCGFLDNWEVVYMIR